LLNPLEGPQANSQEELDSVLDIVTATDSQAILGVADRFVSSFPQSEFLGVILQYKMFACARMQNFECLVASGQSALRVQPDNLNVLLTLASAIPDAADGRAELLAKAQGLAERALERVGTIHIPHEISLERWRTLRGETEAQAHEALGKIAVRQGKLETAIAEFERAAFNNPAPQGSQFLLLGATYVSAGRNAEARSALRRAAELGPEDVRKQASSALENLNTLNPNAKSANKKTVH
jgi:tetratricopeptide (TPR) repeat protein